MKKCPYCGAERSAQSVSAGEKCADCGYTRQEAIAENIHRPRQRAAPNKMPAIMLAVVSVGCVLLFATLLSSSLEVSMNADEKRAEIVARRMAEAPLTIYGASSCPYTQQALAHAKSLGVEYRYIETRRGDENYLESAALGRTRFCLKPMSFTCVPSPIIIAAGEIRSGYSAGTMERALRAGGVIR